MRTELKNLIDEAGGVAKCAEHAGVTRQMVYFVIDGGSCAWPLAKAIAEFCGGGIDPTELLIQEKERAK